ncbi:hypothetical protein LCGC14_2214870 [marine sediment metagenome]|uniref:Uncharacterized protein n=1 Tax=marine sediment metagenome TaxID=412755 RepID=A0A0F9DCM9_9ZZZZ
MVSIGDQINLETNTFPATNVTVTVPAVNATTDITGRELITEIEIVNASSLGNNTAVVGLFLQTGTGTNGLLSVQLAANDTASGIVGVSVNTSYTYNPDGYVSDSGGRAITLLILIFAALAILVFVVVVFIKQGSMGELMRRG